MQKFILLLSLCLNILTAFAQNNSKALITSGIAKDSIRDYRGAISDFKAAIKIDPAKADCYYFKGNSEFHLKDYNAAADDYNKAISLDSDYVDALYNRGNAF